MEFEDVHDQCNASADDLPVELDDDGGDVFFSLIGAIVGLVVVNIRARSLTDMSEEEKGWPLSGRRKIELTFVFFAVLR